MEGSFSRGATYEQWKAKRHFVSELVDCNGSMLDVGCANGFFLRSLQEWTTYRLVPYGIDVREDLIRQAKELFPGNQNNFCVLDARNIAKIKNRGLPEKYDFVFWNFLGQWRITDPKWQRILTQIVSMTNRRTILGFYGTNCYTPQSREWQAERKRLQQLPAVFSKVGFQLSGSRLNPTEYNQLVSWIDQD
jgi:SAM-dependent methyltransferase